MDSEKDINVISDRASKCISNSFDEKLEAPRLSRREYFACAAMQGLISTFTNTSFCRPEQLASSVVEYADALLSELSKEQSEPGKEK